MPCTPQPAVNKQHTPGMCNPFFCWKRTCFNSANRCPVHPLMSGVTWWTCCPLIISIIQDGVTTGTNDNWPPCWCFWIGNGDRDGWVWTALRFPIMSLPTMTVGYFDCDLLFFKEYYVRTWGFILMVTSFNRTVSLRLSTICISIHHQECFDLFWSRAPTFFTEFNDFY